MIMLYVSTYVNMYKCRLNTVGVYKPSVVSAMKYKFLYSSTLNKHAERTTPEAVERRDLVYRVSMVSFLFLHSLPLEVGLADLPV